MTKKQIIALLLIVAVFTCVLLYKGYEATTDGQVKYKIAFVVPTLENPFFVDMQNGAKSWLSKNNISEVEIIVQAVQRVEDDLGQSQLVENLIIQKVDGICIVPTNSTSIIPVLKKAVSAGIPIINIDNKIDSAMGRKENLNVSSYIGSNNFDGGALAGEFIINKLNNIGKVAILEGVSGNDAATKRKGGFLHALKKSRLQIATSQVANWNREQAFNIFQNMLKAHPDLKAVFAANDEMALGALAAAQQSDRKDILIVGFDAIQEAQSSIKEGKMAATIAQQPAIMGAQAVEVMMKILSGKPVEKNYSTELKIITK